MPKSTKKAIEYQLEYQKSPEEVAKRVARNRARRQAIREGKVRVGDSKEIDHIQPLRKGGSVGKANTRVVDGAKNAGWRKGKKEYD